ncbi:MAG: hypothetical protein PVI97_10805 [Candidatus Thiodiazotropha sp.]|jgi:hypothetical protein
MKKIIFAGVALSLMTSVDLFAETIVPAEVMDFAQLGMPYNTDTKDIHNFICINGDTITNTGSPSATIESTYNIDHSKVVDVLSGSLSVGADFALTKLEAGASIANEYKTTQYNTTWTISAVAKPTVKRFDPSTFELSSKCQDYADTYIGDPENLVTRVGDEFVNQMNLGAVVLIQMSLNFSSEEQKDAWEAYAVTEITSTWSFTFEGFLNDLTEEEQQSLSIEVKAFQAGGDPGSLAEVLPNNILSCTAELTDGEGGVQACLDAFSAGTDYLLSFSEQLSDTDSYNVLSFTTAPYLDAGIYELVPASYPDNSVNELYQQQLESMFSEQLDDKIRASNLIGKYSNLLTAERILSVKEVRRIIDQNLYLIAKNAETCYRYPYGTECSDQYELLTSGSEKLLKDYDASLLEMPGIEVVDSITEGDMITDEIDDYGDISYTVTVPAATSQTYRHYLISVFDDLYILCDNSRYCEYGVKIGSLNVDGLSQEEIWDAVNIVVKVGYEDKDPVHTLLSSEYLSLEDFNAAIKEEVLGNCDYFCWYRMVDIQVDNYLTTPVNVNYFIESYLW